ncbi:response regulator [Leptolyngbya sp. FACHB-321]|uniref:hybrid sensor histidine kinase/response regulator n=1 Tax=Leptolyngbya sp. FACHB-321 TaxID=2692807 RepID=UPI0016871162|nr:ATP-binding protein [Leptolyngbya sp. FACHB-321]MBD2033680.1 response regulator [Leptolyngbya sp. FACHB-321]
MPSDPGFSMSRVLPYKLFEQLGNVLQQTAQTHDPTVWVFTEATLFGDRATLERATRFIAVVSQPFSGLLLADSSLHAEPSHYQVELTFDPAAIAAFLATLISQLEDDPVSVCRLQKASQHLQVNDPVVQSEFTLRLADVLVAPQTQLQAQQQQQHLLEQHITQRTQELKEALLSAQTANRIKTEFLATMSHELRTPLTCVIGMAETLLRVMVMKPENAFPLQKQQEYLQLIKRSGEHLLAMVNDILDMSQVEAGKVTLDVKLFSLAQVAHQSVQMLQEQAQSKGVELYLKALPTATGDRTAATNDFFMADPQRVSQILLNLLSNAIKFTPQGGQITLRFGIQHDTALFQVEDTGIGIPENQRHLLFQKFQQLDNALTRTHDGVGLGLALTKQLVELHHGIIEVDSHVGVGTTFSVWLPAQAIAQPTEKGEHPPSLPAPLLPEVITPLPAGKRVVLIEDHDETAMLICDLLTAASFQVVWMVDGATAMRQIKLLKPHLIIANVELPGLEDGAIAQFLHQYSTLQAVKVLLLSEDTSERRQDTAADGATHYLTKPVQPYQLLEKVATLLA